MGDRDWEMTCKGLAIHMVTGMFPIEVRYFVNDEFHRETDLTVEVFREIYGEWFVSYFTIEFGALVVGIREG